MLIRFILQKYIILRLLIDLEPIVLDFEPIVLDRSRVGNQLGNLSTGVTVLRPSPVCSWNHPSSNYRCSNQTLVTIVGTIVRFKVRLYHLHYHVYNVSLAYCIAFLYTLT